VEFDLAAYWREHVEEMKSSLPHFDFTLRLPVESEDFLRFNIAGNSTITKLPDLPGWFRARIQVPSLDSAKMLVFGVGAEAEVVEPEELREVILEEARRIVQAGGVI
jgi:predicted DNA-binding transcriptional regulator YafY